MSKIKNLIVLLLIAGVLWHFYGDAFNRSGLQGVIEEVNSDITKVKESPLVSSTIDTLKQEFQLLYSKLTKNEKNSETANQPTAKKPDLNRPNEQIFSIYNVELGNSRKEVENQVGSPQRSSLNEYGVHWTAYHENYQNFFMVAYDQDNNVVGLFTNQDIISSTNGITFASTRESVRKTLGEPLKGIRKGFVNYQVKNEGEYDTFLIDQYYVTIFYDKHENNTVTAIQMIAEDLEQKKEGFFAEPSEDLKAGFEYQLFDLTNAARVRHGLSPLSWDDAVQKTARDHSSDMAVNNYFSHTNLEGLSPFDRMKRDGIAFQMAGENLASGQMSSIFAHEGLMNSKGHRENILKKGYQQLAIGVAFNAESQPFYTEAFLTK